MGQVAFKAGGGWKEGGEGEGGGAWADAEMDDVGVVEVCICLLQLRVAVGCCSGVAVACGSGYLR